MTLCVALSACVDTSFREGLECDPLFGCPEGQSCIGDSDGVGYHCWKHDAGPIVIPVDATPLCEPDASEECYTGPLGSAVGECHAGTKFCQSDQTWGECEGEVTPGMQCEQRECGPDGCDSICGTCEADIECDSDAGTCLRAEMVAIPAGEFSMGSPGDEPGHATDEPAHDVTLDAFEIDRLEVTNQAYLQCVLDGTCTSPTSCSAGVPVWTGPQSFPSDMAHHPVICVDWAMAKTYCEAVDKRLCSEAEWERAATGATHHAYPWQSDWPLDPKTYLNCDEGYCHDEHEETAAVGTFALGNTPVTALSDMAGNVSEWVLDFYDATFYSTGTQSNPKGPCDGVAEDTCSELYIRAHRGGSFTSPDTLVRCSARGQRAQTSREQFIGIRCCRDPS